jgi:hypothetical protein
VILKEKHKLTRFKSLKVALKELEPFVRSGQHLRTGKPFKRFGDMRSREMLANWLLCITINAVEGGARELVFWSDPHGGDGIIRDELSGEVLPMEHVMVPPQPEGSKTDAQTLILKAIKEKCAKGEQYASGSTLVVFLDAGAGLWKPNLVAQALPDPLLFKTVWVISLRGVENGEYIYNVAHLDLSDGNSPAFEVRISADFESWKVTRVQ